MAEGASQSRLVYDRCRGAEGDLGLAPLRQPRGARRQCLIGKTGRVGPEFVGAVSRGDAAEDRGGGARKDAEAVPKLQPGVRARPAPLQEPVVVRQPHVRLCVTLISVAFWSMEKRIAGGCRTMGNLRVLIHHLT